MTGRDASLPVPLRAVTFDCWATLLFEDNWVVAHGLRVDALQAAAREAGEDPSREVVSGAFDAAWERHMALWSEGVATGATEVARWALGGLGIDHEYPALEHLIQRFEEASHSSRVQALAGARATLETLAGRGVRRGLVCDTGLTPGRVVRLHLSRLGLLDLIEATAFSDEVGVPKPKPGAFHAALEALGVEPRDAVHVGDLRGTDVAGARALGMTTIRIRARYDDTSSLDDADFVVDSHAELRSLMAPEQRRLAVPETEGGRGRR
jgi:putative hydrolase of the HAD superfamily